jgi:hypothetical protein
MAPVARVPIEPGGRGPWRRLGGLLVDDGLISREELDEALAEQRESGERLGEILVRHGLVSGPELTIALAKQLGTDVTREESFGSGLWTAIKGRHPRTKEREAGPAAEQNTGPAPSSAPRAGPAPPRPEAAHSAEDPDSGGRLRDQIESLRARLVASEQEREEAVRAQAETERQLVERRAEVEELKTRLSTAEIHLDEQKDAHTAALRWFNRALEAYGEQASELEIHRRQLAESPRRRTRGALDTGESECERGDDPGRTRRDARVRGVTGGGGPVAGGGGDPRCAGDEP